MRIIRLFNSMRTEPIPAQSMRACRNGIETLMTTYVPAWIDGVLQPVEKLEVHERGLRHKAVSVFVCRNEELLLQRRALGKYHTPGLWANACCTHPNWDESGIDCATRRLREELGIMGLTCDFRDQIEYHADVGNGMIEHEVVGQEDIEIFTWAYEQYWDRVDRGFLIYLGGVWRDGMQPAVADMAVMKGAFATDLSVEPADSAEFALSQRIFTEMEPWSFVLGWHSYLKDTEAMHLTQMSRHTLRQEALNTFPNMSFLTHLELPEGYRFENNHNIDPDTVLTPESKVYITCVQTDGLGIGAWFEPGRGGIPYAWETADGISLELFPVLLRYYYETASPNDYFIGALTGPNYMYPKAIPPDRLPEVVRRVREQMELMDLRVWGLMDYTQGNRYYGNIDLTKEIVDVYYDSLVTVSEGPPVLGLINGYGPARTHDIRDGVPLISYGYYLSPDRPEEDAAADLEELIVMNPDRPYFLAIHVREWSDVDRVKRILDGLGSDVEIVPMDVFMKLAGAAPEFRTWHLDAADLPVSPK